MMDMSLLIIMMLCVINKTLMKNIKKRDEFDWNSSLLGVGVQIQTYVICYLKETAEAVSNAPRLTMLVKGKLTYLVMDSQRALRSGL